MLAVLPVTSRAELSLTGTGQAFYDFSSTANGEWSGITYVGGDSFYIASDTANNIALAEIVIDRATGQIQTASHGSFIALPGVLDLEGIAYDPRDMSVLIAAEQDQSITRFDPTTANSIASITIPAIYNNARGNFGLESLSLDPIGLDLWTANEEALTVDGPLSTQTQGTLVRLQRFDAEGNPAAQFAYRTDPHTGDNNLLNKAQSGVVDLLALPGGDLLVLERTLGGAFVPTYRNRIYLVDTTNATDTANIAELDGGVYTAAVKTQLIQINAQFANYEGIALGPRLDNGDYAVVLISDNGAPNNPQQLLSLRLSGIALPGDLTGDFAVDQDDIDLVLNAWGQDVTAGKWNAGDPSGDGSVGLDDLNTVLRGWTVEDEPIVTIPEPAGLTTLLGGSIALIQRRR